MRLQLDNMRFVVRLLGTWLLGLALILLIIDGTKSLAASELVLTTLGQAWGMVHLSSLEGFEQIISQSGFGAFWQVVAVPILSWPGWAVCGAPGLAMAFLGRSRSNRIRNLNQV